MLWFASRAGDTPALPGAAPNPAHPAKVTIFGLLTWGFLGQVRILFFHIGSFDFFDSGPSLFARSGCSQIKLTCGRRVSATAP
jgi:hypothetical protein